MTDQFKPRAPRTKGRSKVAGLNPLEQLRALLSGDARRKPIEITEDHILSLLMGRRGREASFGRELFSDPAWDILLELYAAHLGSRTVSVSEIAASINTPAEVTARWIAALSGRSLVETELDKSGSNRVFVRLSSEGRAKMKSLADQWGSAFVSI